MKEESSQGTAVYDIFKKLEDGLGEIFESEAYKNWMKMCSKLHNYSLNNTILIAIQTRRMPGFTGILQGYRGWETNFNRHVLKGEKGIRIIAPAPIKKKIERDVIDPLTGLPARSSDGTKLREEAEIKIPVFKPVTVFDASQTEGEPLPELNVTELKFSVENYGDFLKVLTDISPVPVVFEDVGGGAKGYFSPAEQRIVIKDGMSEAQTIKTFVHELCHSLIDDKDNVRIDIEQNNRSKSDKEVTAESTAFVVLDRFGIDTSDYSFGYVASWSSGKDMKELKASMETIKKVSSRIIDGVEAGLEGLHREESERVPEREKEGEKERTSVKEKLKAKQETINRKSAENTAPQKTKSQGREI